VTGVWTDIESAAGEIVGPYLRNAAAAQLRFAVDAHS
jgi:hypothetical protein